MKKQYLSLLTIAAAAALCLPAVAQTDSTTTTNTKSPVINQRRHNQQQRIGEGVENGSLTSGEAARIEHRETRLNKEVHNMKSDGEFTPAERAKVQHQENVLSKNIYNQKHDAQHQNLDPKTVAGQRQLNQQKRIGEGIENGSLTAREATHVETREAAVHHETAAFRKANGGTLTPAERHLVNHQQNKNSRAIYRQKHDKQHR